MTTPKPSLSLTIRLTPEQIGFLAYLYPNEDPEDALSAEQRFANLSPQNALGTIFCIDIGGRT